MYRQSSKRKALIKRIAVSVVMVFSVILTVTLITLFMLGYRLNTSDGDVERYAFFQFGSIPSGATIAVDGEIIGKTPNKSSVPAGEHTVEMWRDGYETWQKTVNVSSGTLKWLNYTLLIPKDLSVEPVANYDTVYFSLASPDGGFMLIQGQSNIPTFSLVDLSSDNTQTSSLTIPASTYSESSTIGVTHTFQVQQWDDGERYVLVKHTYNSSEEWLVVDTQNIASSKNISRLFNLTVSKAVFANTSGNELYILSSGSIYKVSLSSETISKAFVGDVSDFEAYIESSVIVYTGDATSSDGVKQQMVGFYREGDAAPYILRTVTYNPDALLHIAATHYFNENYVVISEGKRVDLLSGSYPNTTTDNANNLKTIVSFDVNQNIDKLSFSPTGEYIFIQSGANFTSYDLEYQTLASSTIDGIGSLSSIKWIDDNHIWSDRDGSLTIREFDGADNHTINSVAIGQAATLTHNGRYLYSINKTDTGYQLQRVRMILP